MSKQLWVHLEGKPIYPIMLEHSFAQLAKAVEAVIPKRNKFCIVTDSTVSGLYLEEVIKMLSPVCRQVDSFCFAAGEAQKNLETVSQLYEFLIQKQYDRKDILVALGGGVTGDLCGFCAATYLRGIDFIQLPTTLLSQVDSSIGGKTGVDFKAYKNMVGAFHMPKLVYTNIATLSTLSQKEFVSGMGEVLKHGLLKSRAYYDWILSHTDEINRRNPDALEYMVYESNQIKRDVVEQDPQEQGPRALLNLGHTLGHAIEKLSNFSMPHGHCVSVGCLAAAAISAHKGKLLPKEVTEIKTAMTSLAMPVTVQGLCAKEIIKATKLDKKMELGRIKFILLEKIGQAYIDVSVSDEDMLLGLNYIGLGE